MLQYLSILWYLQADLSMIFIYDPSTGSPDLSPLWRLPGKLLLSGVGENRAEARSRPLGGQPPGALSARDVCGLAPASARRRGAAPRPAWLHIWRCCAGTPGLV